MKYAIYDKAADGYLTKMEFDVGYSEHTQFECGYNEYITEAKLLDTPKEAADAVARIESFKFMEKGRFVVHSFDEKLADQYIISEAGNPTKVVDNITVDLGGTINVKYGTMACHWSATSLVHVINRMNALQKAVSEIYTRWNNTFMVYKVITIIDEKEHTHYQFINRTITGLVKAEHAEEEKLLVAGNEVVNTTGLLNKRIEELEASNNELRNELCDSERKISGLHSKIESIKKEARTWKSIHKSEGAALDILKDVIDTIYTDLQSVTAFDDLKDTLKAVRNNTDLDHIFMPTKTSYILDNGNCLTAKDEIYYIVNQMITILESRELNQSVAFSSAEETDHAKKLANDIIDICEATTDPFEVTLKKFSQLYEAVNDPSDDDDAIMHAFKAVLEIFSALEDKVRNIIDESVTWKNKAIKAEKAKDNQKKLNEAFNDTIVRYRNERLDMDKENYKLRVARDCLAEVIFAIRNAIYNNDSDAFRCIENRIKFDYDFNSDPFTAGVRENIKDICTAEKKNIANHDLKNSEIARLANERDRALERAEKFKGIVNSVYGMTIPTRCCGKQLMADILSGKKIPIDKKKYDDLVEYVANINLTYDTMFCMMDKPVYLSAITESLDDLTK